jgi:hypothetical protein
MYAPEALAPTSTRVIPPAAEAAIWECTPVEVFVDQKTHRQGDVVYLNGSSLDRGTLTVGPETVAFSGWQGKIEVPLRSLQGIELGSSNLPARAGIPILSALAPGERQAGDSLLLTVQQSGKSTQELVALANVRNGEELLFDILMKQDALMSSEPGSSSGAMAGRPEHGL